MNNPEIFVEMSLADGLIFVSKDKSVKQYIGEQRVSTASGSALFVKEKENLTCVCCGIKANKWIAFKAKHQPPVLNLYGQNENGEDILFTRDHIIPKAFGGNDDLKNLRVMCKICNEKRSCNLDDESLVFYHLNMNELILSIRIENSIQRLKKRARNINSDTFTVISNFQKIFTYLEQKNALNMEFQNYKKEIDSLYTTHSSQNLSNLNSM